MNRLIAYFFCALSPLTVLAGCAADEKAQVADGEDQETHAASTVLEAKLYREPNAKIDAKCDVYTELKVEKARGGLTLNLEEKLSESSICEKLPFANKRSFKVTEYQDPCGSTFYESAKGPKHVRLEDNRARKCEDPRLADLVVEETGGPESPLKLYGQAAGSDAEPVSKLLEVKLYDKPNVEPDKFCDTPLILAIGQEGSKLIASLRMAVVGPCEIYVEPDARSYAVSKKRDNCGTVNYVGVNEKDTLIVADHRARSCEDVIPDLIEVTEKRGGKTHLSYGAPGR